MEWRLEATDLVELVGHAVEANRGLFGTKGVTLTVHGPNGLPRVLADRDKIIQVVTNLLSNAVKFTPAGGQVWVRTLMEGGSVVLEVEDTGPGIPPDQADLIFERFRQVGDTLSAKPEGAGLGLPISREIVQHHGGSLRVVRSEAGRGARFRMTLPLAA